MKQKRYLIYGLAKSGESAFNLILNKKDKIYLYDDNKLNRKVTRIMGLTATASTNVCQDILAEFMNFKTNTKLIQASSLRRNNK